METGPRPQPRPAALGVVGDAQAAAPAAHPHQGEVLHELAAERPAAHHEQLQLPQALLRGGHAPLDPQLWQMPPPLLLVAPPPQKTPAIIWAVFQDPQGGL